MKNTVEADAHAETEMLLPWYVTGQLSREEHESVEAHLTTCEVCSGQLPSEQRLRAAVAAMDPESEAAGWAALRGRIEAPLRPRRRWGTPRRLAARIAARPGLTIGLAAAQAAAFALVFMVARPPAVEPSPYSVLGAAPSGAVGNAMIVFRPDVTERELRETLNAADATIVGGPTAANAYILSLPEVDRTENLRSLRSERAVVLAEAIDAEPRP